MTAGIGSRAQLLNYTTTRILNLTNRFYRLSVHIAQVNS